MAGVFQRIISIAGVLGPVMLVLIAGYLLQRAKRLDTRPLATLSVYVLSPSLVFSSLVTSTVTFAEVSQVVAFVALVFAGMWLVTWVFSKLTKLDRSSEAAMFLSTLFVNCGNYGLPVVQLAYGAEGMARGILFLVTQAFPASTVAVYYAAKGTRSTKQALVSMFSIPMLYAPFLALFVRLFSLPLVQCKPLFAPIQMMGEAAIPVALFTLGMELANVHKQGIERSEKPLVFSAVLLRLVAGSLVAFLAAKLLGITGMLFGVVVLEASMPTAVNSMLLAITFEGRSRLVAAVVFLSTIASFFTLSVILAGLL